MSEIDVVCIVHTTAADQPHRSWICRATHINDEYITTTMGRFSTTTRQAVAPAAPLKLVMEGDEDYQRRLDLGVSRGGYWAISGSHPHGQKIRASIERGVYPR